MMQASFFENSGIFYPQKSAPYGQAGLTVRADSREIWPPDRLLLRSERTAD